MRVSKPRLAIVALAAATAVAAYVLIVAPALDPEEEKLRVGLAPYQDMALLVNYEFLKLEDKYDIDLELVTLAWGDLIPAVASAGPTVDVSFGGLIQYLNKVHTLNAGSDDPVLFVFPLYVFKGGALVSFDPKVPDLTGGPVSPKQVEALLRFRLGFPKHGVIHMLVWDVARQAEIPPTDVDFVDVPYDEALLAALSGSLDAVGVGLTQRAEALKQGGRVVLDMDAVGFADITGFLLRESTLVERRDEIEKLIRIWFDCVNYVLADIDENSNVTLAYLDKTAATDYSVESFKEALSNEYFPRSVEEARRELLDPAGRYGVDRIANSIADFLVREGLLEDRPPALGMIDLSD